MARRTALDMTLAEVFPALIAKAERKGRMRTEVYACTTWLLGYSADDIDRMLEDATGFRAFLENATLCPDAHKVTGSICGVKIDEIEDPTTKTMRRLDKLIDELAKGKPLEKVLRSEATPAKWKCPKCGREFKNKGQDHYCGEAPKSVDEYIQNQNEELQGDLRLLRQILREALPDAEERISWNMPTYWNGRNILQFAAFKKHIGFYPGSEAVEEFATELQGLSTNKGTVRIPYGEIDPELIAKIAKWCEKAESHAR